MLVAGIGNIFCGDDAFGVEVIRELLRREWPAGIRIEDFGVRAYDLAYAIMDAGDAVILVDATPRGQPPGTVSLIELDLSAVGSQPAEILNAHSLTPIHVLQMVRSFGGQPRRLYLVGCEPAILDADELGLSEPVQAAIPTAVQMIESLVYDLQSGSAPSAITNQT